MGTDDLISQYIKTFGGAKTQSLHEFVEAQFKQLGRQPVIAVDAYQWIFHLTNMTKQWSETDKWPLERQFKKMLNLRMNMFETLGVKLVMVLDGPYKPVYKRDKVHDWNIGRSDIWVNYLVDACFHREIQTIRAPGEGEAECSRLQLEGSVDWVFSNDSDCLLFGATKVVKFADNSNSSTSTETTGAGNSINKKDRMVTCVEITKLNRANFILYALLVGGDYDTSGVLRMGKKCAMEIIKDTPFGNEFGEILDIEDLARMPSYGRDSPALETSTTGSTYSVKELLKNWRERLNHELATNEAQMFSRRNGSKILPKDFPNMEVVDYYVNPSVNRRSEIRVMPVIDIARLYKYFERNFPYEGYEVYSEFSNMFSVALLVRRIFGAAEVPQSFHVIREVTGSMAGMVRLELNLHRLLEDIEEPSKKPVDVKAPVGQRDVWKFVLEHSTLGELQRFYEEQSQSRKLKRVDGSSSDYDSSLASPSKRRLKARKDPSFNNRSISEFFFTKSYAAPPVPRDNKKHQPVRKLSVKSEGPKQISIDTLKSPLASASEKIESSPTKSDTEVKQRPTRASKKASQSAQRAKNNMSITSFFTAS